MKYFVEKECGNTFSYMDNDERDICDLPHRVWVGYKTGQVRYAKVLKTVAYIAVDEDEYGEPVLEKWAIRNRTTGQLENCFLPRFAMV